jgi:hypothetical protein
MMLGRGRAAPQPQRERAVLSLTLPTPLDESIEFRKARSLSAKFALSMRMPIEIRTRRSWLTGPVLVQNVCRFGVSLKGIVASLINLMEIFLVSGDSSSRWQVGNSDPVQPIRLSRYRRAAADH